MPRSMTYPFVIHLAYRPQKPPELWFPLRQWLAVQGVAFGRGESTPGVRHQSIDCLRRFHYVSGCPSPIARSFGGCGGFATTLYSAISSSATWAEVGTAVNFLFKGSNGPRVSSGIFWRPISLNPFLLRRATSRCFSVIFSFSLLRAVPTRHFMLIWVCLKIG